ncbi:MAG TPA: hypothetical protein VKA08_14275 [Balneolales bacterium]|nr:hypothetical protein [Balneolales bacterium]
MNGPMMDGGGCKEARESEVRKWMMRLSKELARAAELHDRVRERIACVLRDDPPCCKEDTPPDEQLTPLASEIRENVRKLENLSGGYEAMLGHIEL